LHATPRKLVGTCFALWQSAKLIRPRYLMPNPLQPARPNVDRDTVLIVTDGALGAAATRVLQQEGYDVVTARHAGHAYLVALTRARIDFLISESRLDEMTGEALATRVRRYHPKLRSLYVADGQAEGSAHTLVRPFTREELLERLSRMARAATSQAS
jgi:DNA-binding response OmpR family regulator